MNNALVDSVLRARAEAQIASGNLPSRKGIDPLRMLHELQVHEIELELQNEALISANRELESLRLKYQSFYDEAPVGYLTLSSGGEIVEFNACAHRMLKRKPEMLRRISMRDMFGPDSQLEFDSLLQKAEVGGVVVSTEYLLVERPGGVPIFVRAQARRVLDAAERGQLVLLVIMDVTSLKFAMDDVISTIAK